jgi:hypothetical protein
MTKQSKKKTSATKARIHISREDRARTNAGKTVNSKVRSEGRTLAALERAAVTHRNYEAEKSKERLSE